MTTASAISVSAAVEFSDEDEEQDLAPQDRLNRSPAVVAGNDWTTETLVAQLRRENISLNPTFQRRDAWKIDRKSRFIESLVVGLPIPQVVLAESRVEPGRFIVLDGKQRLLSVLQFWGGMKEPFSGYRLQGLTLRKDLRGVDFEQLSTQPKYRDEYNALCNQAIRTVVIRNWPDTEFLHTVFLRLNTGSVKLSPQELRQALMPGAFSTYIDDAAGDSTAMRLLLGIDQADSRMRDIEILARFIAFRLFHAEYPGRMKRFLDDTFDALNKSWGEREREVRACVKEFELGVAELRATFGDQLARKPGSPQFNRAVFDALIHFHSQPSIRAASKANREKVRKAYASLFAEGSDFLKAIESDTAGTPNTVARLRLWAAALSKALGKRIAPPPVGPTSVKSP